MTNWLFLPLDGRPCNARFPVELASLIQETLITPPVEFLGNAQQAARRDRLASWVESRIDTAKGLLLSLDTWIYGNLVASRKNQNSQESLLKQIQLLKNLKQRNPELKIYGFATLLRLSNSNDNTEERTYWKQHGQQIYRYSYLEHYLSQNKDPQATLEFEALSTAIPNEVLDNYRQLRQRNLSILQSLLEETGAGLFENLLIGCDDGGSYGWTIQEKQILQNDINNRQLAEKVLLYPGADELACTLVARALVPAFYQIQVKWTYPEAQSQITRYEGLPLIETLAHQAKAVGMCLHTDEAEGIVWIHNPPGEQIDQFLDRESRVSFQPEQIQELMDLLAQNTSIALADVLYANGGDIELLQELESQQLLFNLKAYAAWNTAGNTLGMLLAWYKCHLYKASQTNLHRRFLLDRLCDDGWYQGYLRQQLCAHYTEPVTMNSCIRAIAYFNDKLRDWQNWMPDAPACLQVKQLSFPWRRFFEVDLQVCDKTLEQENCLLVS